MEQVPIKIEGELSVTLRMVEQRSAKKDKRLNYVFGVSHVDMTLGFAPLSGVAMYAKTFALPGGEDKEYRWVTNDWDSAFEWFRGRGADAATLEQLNAAYWETMPDDC